MPRGWQKFNVYLTGREDPLEVQTTARDFAAVPLDAANGIQPIDLSYRAVHAALRRLEVEGVPASYDEFLDTCLDGFPDLLEGEPALLDPTRPARSVAQP